MNALDILYIPLFLILALYFPRMVLLNSEKKFLKTIQYLILFHFLLGIAYYFFILSSGGDAMRYYNVANRMSSQQFWENIISGEGTPFMEALNFIPANLMGMSFLSNSMFYSMLGSFGIVFFFLIAIRTIVFNPILKGYALIPLLFFLPNLHFWSAGVGKDTTLFLCIAMFAYGVMEPLKRIPLIVFGLLIAMAIRPHIVLFLFVGFGVAYVFGGKVSGFQRILFSIVLIGGGIAILPSVMEFAKIEEASAAGFEQFAQKKADVLSRASTGSAIDISSYPFPLKVFTFLFRPLFFDVRNLNGLIASIENLALLVLFIMAMAKKPLKAFKAAPFVIKGLVIFLIVGTLAFSQSLGNVGIMIRMRNMFLPGMIIFILWVFSYHYQTRISNNK